MRRTPFYHLYRDRATIVAGGAWETPLRFTDNKTEHVATRTKVGLFDLSTMGEILVLGPGAKGFLDSMAVNSLANKKVGDVLYTTFCNENGGILDDVTVYVISDSQYMVVTSNIFNCQKLLKWFAEYCPREGVEIVDISSGFALASVQGPLSRDLLNSIAENNINDINYFKFRNENVQGIKCLISRTGYTGELGYEVYCPAENAHSIYLAIHNAGCDFGLHLCGLEALQSLRIEKAYPLYGFDISESTNPYEAGLGWTVKLNKEFVGAKVLKDVKHNGPAKKLVSVKVKGSAMPQRGAEMWHNQEKAGVLTSICTSYSLENSIIGLALVNAEFGADDTILEIRNENVIQCQVQPGALYDPRGERLRM